MTRSTCGSSASATAGGKSRCAAIAEEFGENETVRGAAVVATLGICTPRVVARAAISNGSWGANVRVAFGITVLLKRSLFGFSSGGNTGFGGAFSVAAPLVLLLLK